MWHVRMEARRRLIMARAELAPSRFDAYSSVLDGENHKLIREVASWRDPVTSRELDQDTQLPRKVPLGQALLLETPAQWFGSFDLDDPETMAIFRQYVGRTQ